MHVPQRNHLHRAPRLAALALLGCLVVHALAARDQASVERFSRIVESEKKKFAQSEALLVVHYHRADGDYASWNLWCWPKGGDGAAYAFNKKDSFGCYATVAFAKNPGTAGFILRKGEWQAKDIDTDRIVDFASNPLQEIWLASGDAKMYMQPTAVDLTTRIVGAFLDAPSTITLATSQSLTVEQLQSIRVFERGKEKNNLAMTTTVPVNGAAAPSLLYKINLAKPVAPDKIAAYLIRVADMEAQTVYARDALNDPRFTPLEAKLGATCTAKESMLSTWSPVSDSVDVLLYENNADTPTRTIALKRKPMGLWSTTIAGDLHGTRYRYRFQSYGVAREVPDIHAGAATPDSAYSVLCEASRLNPANWENSKSPKLAHPTDEVLYEIHVRDFSIADPSCPAAQRGTYLGLVHKNPATATTPSTGLSHLQDLGVTAVHLLPIQDFTAEPKEYNWGYWTALFNVPESNYATSISNPLQPQIELKQAIQALHEAKIRVVMDVVYNHTSSTGEHSPFDQTVPFYFHRTAPDGSLLNDTGVGNTLADERPMVRKYIVDSLLHWLLDYRVDGFRFDLLGTMHAETVRAICEKLVAQRPDITLYGEPWTGGGPTHFPQGAQKDLRMAVFNDHLRNAIRGDLDGTATGFATGPGGDREAVKRGVVGAIDDFTTEPSESVNYVSAHDNLTLWDKLLKAQPTATDATRAAMQKLSLGIVLTSQGIAFLDGGSDFARTKGGNNNSYNAGDAVNQFEWSRKSAFASMHSYIRGLIAMRRAHPAFRMSDDADVRKNLHFLSQSEVLVLSLLGGAAGDSWRTILVAYNGEPHENIVRLPPGSWSVVVNSDRAGNEDLEDAQNIYAMPAYSMLVAHLK